MSPHMTTATDTAPLTSGPARAMARSRFVIAFVAGLVAVLVLGAGALLAYDRQYEGRILPGVRAGSVDLSGLTATDAQSRLEAAYGGAGEGELVLAAGNRTITIPYADIGR